MAHYVRKRLLVNRAQYRLLGFNLFYYFVFVGSISLTLWGPLIVGLRSADVSQAEREEMASLFLYLHSRVLPIALALACVSTAHSIVVSHRIVGPLVRFKAVYKRIGGGFLGDRIRLRKRDYLHAEAAELNGMIEGLSARLQGLDSKFAGIQREWTTLKQELNRNDGMASDAELERMESCFAEYRQAWGEFEFESKQQDSVALPLLEAQEAICPQRQREDEGLRHLASLRSESGQQTDE